MKFLKSLFHFLGGIRLAIALLSLAGIAAIAGTIVESKTNSHLLAAKWTYEHAAFFWLLALFFINILFAALRRWPFQKRHIPFLITHLGLLMVIGGTIIKNRWGLQGQMTLLEGSGSQHVLIPHTHSLLIEERGAKFFEKEGSAHPPSRLHLIEFKNLRPGIYSPFLAPQLKCKLIAYVPHAEERLETWIKGSFATIAGFPKIPVCEWDCQNEFPLGAVYSSSIAPRTPWSILALRTSQTKEAIVEAYLRGLTLRLKPKDKAEEPLEMPLHEALQSTHRFLKGNIACAFALHDLNEDAPRQELKFTWHSEDNSAKETFVLPLEGQDSLFVKNISTPWAEPPFSIDLIRPALSLALIEDFEGKTAFLALDSAGRFFAENYHPSELRSLLSYDFGFGGYAVQASVPIPNFPAAREDKEKAGIHAMTEQLRQALAENPPLAPPLRLFEKACNKAGAEFSSAFFQFLDEWRQGPGFLFDARHSIPPLLEEILVHLDWEALSFNNLQALHWTARLLEQLEESWNEGKDPIDVLEAHHWPFAKELRQKRELDQNLPLLNLIGEQMSSLASHLPPIDLPPTPTIQENAKLLSAYFRIYGIDARTLLSCKGSGKEQFDELENYWKDKGRPLPLQKAIVFETSLNHRIHPKPLPQKPEDERPAIVMEVQEGQEKETIALEFQAGSRGLKWPILRGKYALRFQPKIQEVPYRIRLREAREIFYPQTSQVYSYESSLLVSGKNLERNEQTLSMNRVFETWDGYRFYLAGISHLPDFGIKRIQLAVNYDPAKYLLTYPGAALVFLGILLLFWLPPRRQTKPKK